MTHLFRSSLIIFMVFLIAFTFVTGSPGYANSPAWKTNALIGAGVGLGIGVLVAQGNSGLILAWTAVGGLAGYFIF